MRGLLVCTNCQKETTIENSHPRCTACNEPLEVVYPDLLSGRIKSGKTAFTRYRDFLPFSEPPDAVGMGSKSNPAKSRSYTHRRWIFGFFVGAASRRDRPRSMPVAARRRSHISSRSRQNRIPISAGDISTKGGGRLAPPPPTYCVVTTNLRVTSTSDIS